MDRKGRKVSKKERKKERKKEIYTLRRNTNFVENLKA